MWCIFVYLYCNSTVHQTEWMMRVNMNAHTLANWPEWLAVLLSPTCKLTEMSPSDWIDRPNFLPASPAMFAPLWCTFMYFEVVLGTFWYLGVLWGAFRYFEVLLGALAKLLDVQQPWSLHHYTVLWVALHATLTSYQEAEALANQFSSPHAWFSFAKWQPPQEQVTQKGLHG